MSTHEMTARVLQDAAAVIERDGWCQGSYRNSDGAHCTLGALSVALDRDWGSIPHGHLAYLALRRLIGAHYVHRWNDDPARTKQEVLDAFHAAAKAELRLADGAA